MQIKTYIPSKAARALLYLLGALVVLFLLAELGLVTHFAHPRFESLRGIHRHFAIFGIPHLLFLSGPGTLGTITHITGNIFTVSMRDGSIRTVKIGTSTLVRSTTNAPALKTGETVIVFGHPAPDDSINARLIRILTIATSSQTIFK